MSSAVEYEGEIDEEEDEIHEQQKEEQKIEQKQLSDIQTIKQGVEYIDSFLKSELNSQILNVSSLIQTQQNSFEKLEQLKSEFDKKDIEYIKETFKLAPVYIQKVQALKKRISTLNLKLNI